MKRVIKKSDYGDIDVINITENTVTRSLIEVLYTASTSNKETQRRVVKALISQNPVRLILD